MMVEVLKAGFFTTIQDTGRFGYGGIGVPQSGPMDSYSANFANVLLNNDRNASLLEMTMTGCSLRFNMDTQIAITGSDMSPVLDNKPLQMYKTIEVNAGQVLEFGRPKLGFRTYLAIHKGFKSQHFLGSTSFYYPITKKLKLEKGDIIDIGASDFKDISKNAYLKFDHNLLNQKGLHVWRGPEFDQLSPSLKIELFSREFTVAELNNRMAYQVKESLSNNIEPILTSPVLPGTVQLTPSGKLIILMRDCQTTGGYPRILQLTENSINCLSQKRSGDTFLFEMKE